MHSFPTFWLNVLEYLAGGAESAEAVSISPGKSVTLHATGNATELTVVDPKGNSTKVSRSDQDVFTYHDTDEPGIYQVKQGEQVIDRFAVNLFDRTESNVRVAPSADQDNHAVQAADIQIGHVDVAPTAERTPARHEIWKLLLLAALFVLILEWYIYNRRVYL
jgi:VCBS repeat-containing protein